MEAGDRRICFIFSTREQQILRCAQDDASEKQLFSSLLGDDEGRFGITCAADLI